MRVKKVRSYVPKSSTLSSTGANRWSREVSGRQTPLLEPKSLLLRAPRLTKTQVFLFRNAHPARSAAKALWMRLCPLLHLVTHLHSSAHLEATCNRWGKSSGMSLAHSHTRGYKVSPLGPAGTLHTHLHLLQNRKTTHCDWKVTTICYRNGSFVSSEFRLYLFEDLVNWHVLSYSRRSLNSFLKQIKLLKNWTVTYMDANQLVTSQEDYFVCHTLVPHIRLTLRQGRKRFMGNKKPEGAAL